MISPLRFSSMKMGGIWLALLSRRKLRAAEENMSTSPISARLGMNMPAYAAAMVREREVPVVMKMRVRYRLRPMLLTITYAVVGYLI